jgi:hypothetical protein
MKRKMASKNLLLGALVIALVFGMTVVGCEEGNETYDPVGTWTVTGQSTIFTVTASNTWTISGGITDSGTFTRNGNVGTLYSSSFSANIGTATLTSNTTMTLNLVSPSTVRGTFNATKQ